MISPIYQWKIKWMFKGIVFVCVGFLESLLIHGNIEAMHGWKEFDISSEHKCIYK